jgi:hypothetical protein
VRYVSSTGASLGTPTDTVEESTTLNVTTQRKVALRFTAVDLTMRLDDFSKRVIQPAVSQLAADIEADALSMANDVYNVVNNTGASMAFRTVLNAKRRLTEALAPADSRIGLLNTQDVPDFIDSTKGLFHDSAAIKEQYREGMIGRTGGFEFYENTLIPTPTSGTALAATTYTVNGASQTGSTVTIQTGSTTFAVGDVVTFAGCFAVHPETKATYPYLQTFVVTAAYAGGGGNLAISPAIVTSGPRQNVSASPTNSGAVTKIAGGTGASYVYRPSLFFHPDAFTFATADLEMPGGVDFSARKNFEGVSMRIVRQYDINEDRFPCRLDVLYGFRTMRAELAARVLSN